MASFYGNYISSTSYPETSYIPQNSFLSSSGTETCPSCGQIYSSGYRPNHICGIPDYDITDPHYIRPDSMSKEEIDKIKKEAWIRYIRRKVEEEAEEKREEREKIERKKNWKIGMMDNSTKKYYLNMIRKTYSEYENERRWKKIMDGLKWFFIALGLAVLINFSKILEIVKLALGK